MLSAPTLRSLRIAASLTWTTSRPVAAPRPRLPAQLTLAAPGQERGAALGIFATAQFLGAFLGGALGGVLLGRFGLGGVFWGSAVVAAAWAALAAALGRSAPIVRQRG